MGYPAVHAHPFKFGEPSSAPYAFIPHFRRPAAAPPPPPTLCRPAPSTSAAPHLVTPLAAVNGPARSHPLLLQPSPHASRSHHRTLPNAAEPGFAPSPPSPRASHAGSRPAAPPPPAVHVVCTAPLVAPKPLPYHSPTFLQFDLPDDDEDLSHPPYVSRPHKRKRRADDGGADEGLRAAPPPATKRRARRHPGAARAVLPQASLI